MKKTIEDFGNKIGGARKDDYKISWGDYCNLDDKAQVEACTKQNIWKISFPKMIKEGVNPLKVGWVKQVYACIPAPLVTIKEERDQFFQFVLAVKEVTKQYLELPMNEWELGIDRFVTAGNEYYFDICKLNNSHFVKEIKFQKVARIDKKAVIKYLLDHNLYLSEYEKAKYTTGVHFYDGKNVSNDVFGLGNCLTIREGLSSSFRYSELYSNLKVGDYFLTNFLFEQLYKIADNDEVKANMKKAITATSKEEIQEKLEIFCHSLSKMQKFLTSNSEPDEQEEEPAPKKPRKKAFKAITVEYETRRNCEYSFNKDFTGDDYLKTFGFYGGEFGNWLSQDDRQATLNCGYDSFLDLAYCLGIEPKSISLGGKLSIAFGARGRGGKGAASAHYEPLYNVINLTKYKGAGCLAHEWGHALDYYLSSKGMEKEMGEIKKLLKQKETTIHIRPYTDEELLAKRKEEVRKSVDEYYATLVKKGSLYVGYKEYVALSPEQTEELKSFIVDTFCEDRTVSTKGDFLDRMNKIHDYVKNLTGNRNAITSLPVTYRAYDNVQSPTEEKDVIQTVKTDYLKDSIEFAEKYTAQGSGYWDDDKELFARAFDQWVCEKLGYTNYFLTADFYIKQQPHLKDEEKEVAQKALENLIETAKNKGLLQEFVFKTDNHLKEFFSK